MRQTVRAILLNRNNYLLLVQHKERDPKSAGKWATIGGGIDEGESHEISLKREIEEEFGRSAGNNIQIGSKLRESRRPDRTDHFYVVWFDGDDLDPIVPDEILAHRWFKIEEIEGLQLFFGFEKELYSLAMALTR
jgi:8-oxo-dGTP pyrophosphatase MutT (NUDIX family)